MQSNPQSAPVPPPPPSPPARIWTSLNLIQWTRAYFEKKGIENTRLEAELLLAAVLQCPRIRLYVDFEKPVPPEKLVQFRDYVKRRAEKREPLQYILGQMEFIDLRLKVTPAVLIPRPETELLAVWALERIKESIESVPKTEESIDKIIYSVLDLCTGSGCLALYLASKAPTIQMLATDLSPEALLVAKANAESLKLTSNITFYEGDLFAAIPADRKGCFDILISNPPYVNPAQRETLQSEVRDHEPALALFAEEEGLAILKRIIAGAGEWLKPGAWMGLEFGIGQAEAVRELAENGGMFQDIEIKKDGSKIPRFLVCKRK